MGSRSMQEIVGRWGMETFPESTPETIVRHLQEEVEETFVAITNADAEVKENHAVDYWMVYREIADCQLLLFHLAHRYGVDLDRITELRFSQVKDRTFGPSEHGYWKTVEGGDA